MFTQIGRDDVNLGRRRIKQASPIGSIRIKPAASVIALPALMKYKFISIMPFYK